MQHQLSRRLAERLLGKVTSGDIDAAPLSVRTWADSQPERSRGFDWLSVELSHLLGEDISRETLRRWYYDPEPKREPRPRRAE